MRLPSKPVWFVIGIHTLCVGVGFWFLIQLVISSTENQAYDAAQSELAERTQSLAEPVRALRLDELTFNSPSIAIIQKLAAAIPNAEHTGVVVVNDAWQFQKSVTKVVSESWQIGENVTWKGDLTPQAAGKPVKGRIVTPEGDRAANCYPLADSNAYLVLFDTMPVEPLWRKQLLSNLPIAVAIALFWTLSLSSVLTYLLSARLHHEETHHRAKQDHNALQSAQDLLRTRDAVIFGLAKLAESRDPETGHHLERISLYCTRLATSLRTHPKYRHTVTPTFVRLLGISSVLHDIGKVGVEDAVLLKPGKLTDNERRKMQQHTLVAGTCLKDIEQRLGASNFLQTAREIAMYHHERWDGRGYPTGLAGEAIPLSARIIAIADVYDALSSKRCYKEAYPHDRCVRLIAEGSGRQFDPELVKAFLAIKDEFAAIAKRFASESTSSPWNSTNGEEQADELDRMTCAEESMLLNVLVENASSQDCSDTEPSLA